MALLCLGSQHLPHGPAALWLCHCVLQYMYQSVEYNPTRPGTIVYMHHYDNFMDTTSYIIP